MGTGELWHLTDVNGEPTGWPAVQAFAAPWLARLDALWQPMKDALTRDLLR